KINRHQDSFDLQFRRGLLFKDRQWSAAFMPLPRVYSKRRRSGMNAALRFNGAKRALVRGSRSGFTLAERALSWLRQCDVARARSRGSCSFFDCRFHSFDPQFEVQFTVLRYGGRTSGTTPPLSKCGHFLLGLRSAFCLVIEQITSAKQWRA